MPTAEERDPLTHKQMRKWGRYVEKNTTLSPQEAQIFVRLFQMHKQDICDDLDIEMPHLKTVINRINEKVGCAHETAAIGKVLSTRERRTIPSMPFGSALIGCSGPDCPNDVETALSNSRFDNFYTQTINLHGDDREVNNSRELHFCSLDCLQQHDELAKK